ncbi:zinc ribbon domain-containing protein [Methanobacterium sp. MZD130B]|uniref:zinc ribbon domain-containing protein n=1 Tax=Methanobacterium sp. MZD130B TaxID=3394378 RepID=UPI0039FD5EA8
MICQNCGHENDMDATFCDNCGARLGRNPNFGRQRPSPPNTGMSQTNKILILAVVVLVGVLGVTAGLLLQSNNNPTTMNTPSSVSESGEKITYKADWHKVTSFSGISDDYRSFLIKGQQFKVVMSATPTLNYNTNYMNIDVSDTSHILGSGEVNWGPTDALSSKEKTVKVTGPPGTYWVYVTSKDLESWTVTVYDYY